MAVEKKTSTAKTASNAKVAPKKSVAQKTSATAKPKPKRIEVGIGQQKIVSFTLTPKLPDGSGKPVQWSLVYEGKELRHGVEVSFDPNSKEPDRSFERAVLIINLDQESTRRENGHWRFALNGVITDKPDADADHDIGTDITNGGTTLIAFVHSSQDTKTKPELIAFGYVANYTDPTTNQIFTYESADPIIVVGRPA